MDVDWKKIRKDYETSSKSAKELAIQYGVKPTTLRSRKNREEWTRSQKLVSDKRNSIATQRNAVATNELLRIDAETGDLTDKQRLFCAYYMQRFNATWAYHKVYGSSWETSRTQGSVFLTKPNIKKELDRLKKLNEEQLHATQLDVTRKLLETAFADLGDYVHFGNEKRIDDDGNEYRHSYTYFNEDSNVDTRLIKEVHIGQNGPEIKLDDRLKALELLYKMLPEVVTSSGEKDGLIEAVKAGIAKLTEGKYR
ncbi:terminase [Levilactobacillus brevis]|uniref:Terminase n=1 Tax=Levilactobacillus brevis TaxID=1580 RepID=A0A2A3TYK6_LEVBR|nr:terminase small subunit [Levilactobacillus brevis]PBQ23851.1 terminase [Levilactobacillus brevis]